MITGIAPAAAENRTLDLYYTHTKERLTITFKKNGKYVPSALKELNRFLRDWRRNEPTNMDPRLFDTVWEVYRRSGSRQPIHVVSAYRSLATNNMLRSRSKGVAKHSQHTLGKAMDFFLPDVRVSKLREIAVSLQRGGIGYYPSANNPFVHVDVGNVRAWPRLSRSQLAKIFPDGKTVHIPADGKPMARYQEALAEIKRTGAVARNIDFADDDGSGKKARKGLLAMLFGDEEDADTEISAAAGGGDEEAAPAPAKRTAPAAKTPPPAVVAEEPAPAKPAAPAVVVEAPLPRSAPEPVELPFDVAEAPAAAAPVEVAEAAPPPPNPRRRPVELIDAAAAAEAVLAAQAVPPPPKRPDVPAAAPEAPIVVAAATPTDGPVTTASIRGLTPAAPTAAAAPAPGEPANAQMALAEVVRDPVPVISNQALGYAAAIEAPPATRRPAIRTARLTPSPDTVGLAHDEVDQLAPLEGQGENKADPLAQSKDLPAIVDLPLYDSASTAWRGVYARLSHPNQLTVQVLYAEPTEIVVTGFGRRAYGEMTPARFTGEALPRLPVLSFSAQRKLAAR